MRHIFFDVSDLRGHLAGGHRISGIQRVTLMVLDEAARLIDGDTTVHLSYLRRGTYQSVAYTPAASRGSLLDQVSRSLGLATAAPVHVPSLEKYTPGTAKYAFHRGKRQINAIIGNEAHFTRRGITLSEWKGAMAPSGPAPKVTVTPVSDLAGPGDTVFVLGAFWADPALPGHLLRLRQAGVEVATLVHDLIPILFPQYVAGHHGQTFHAALHGSLAYTSRYIANSDCTARDLQQFLEVHDADTPVDTVPLAQTGLDDGSTTAPKPATPYALLQETARVRGEIKALLKQPYALYVGTWDIRKNLWRLARAWDRLMADRDIEVPKLVLAGAPGWGNDDFARMMEATGNLGGLIELIHAPSDAELDFLYRHCDFTVFPSLYEGWGLPVGEGLSYGKTALAAEISSIPEVGGDLVAYCDPTSVRSIADTARRLIADPGARRTLESRISQARLRQWSDVARDVLFSKQTVAT